MATKMVDCTIGTEVYRSPYIDLLYSNIYFP